MMIWTFEFCRPRREVAGVIYIRAVERFASVVPFISRGGPEVASLPEVARICRIRCY